MSIYTIGEQLKEMNNQVSGIKGIIAVNVSMSTFDNKPAIFMTENAFAYECQHENDIQVMDWTEKSDCHYKEISGVVFYTLVEKEV